MNPIKLYLLHFRNINKLYDTFNDKKAELASRIPGCATINNKVFLDCLWCICVVLEPIVSLIFISCYLPFFIYKVIFRRKGKPVGNNMALCYAGLARQRIKIVKEVYEVVDYCLYPIFVNEGWLIEGKERHNILERVSIIEVFKSYFWAILCIIFATIKTHGKYLYRNYLSFEYILTDYYFKKIPQNCTLYFVNHLDRWAVLFNQSPQTNKVLLQHGIESPKADWPVKLTNVNKAFVLSESQKECLTRAVLGHETVLSVMPPTITLTEMPSSLKKNIVLVAYPNYMYYDKEEYIIKALSDENCRVFVKIHPGKNDSMKYLNLKKTVNPNIEIISTPTFPRADLVVSYYSTLGIEYEAYNIPVLYYDEHSLDEIVKEIKKKIIV
jgi:hypothetical protein